MKKTTAATFLILVLVSVASWQMVGISQNTDHPPSAGAATSLSGPGCLADVATYSTGTVTVIPDETDAGLIVNTTIAHERGEQPNVTLTRTAPGEYTLCVTTASQETPGPSETATPDTSNETATPDTSNETATPDASNETEATATAN